jgi:hypothetical protein
VSVQGARTDSTVATQVSRPRDMQIEHTGIVNARNHTVLKSLMGQDICMYLIEG